MERLRAVRTTWWVVAAILLFFGLALDSMVEDSPTMDEQNHLARGMAILRTGDPRLSLEHPPLVNGLSALPLLSLPDVRLPLDHPSWQRQPPDVYWYDFADQFLWHYNDDVMRMVFLGRLPILFLTLGLALVGFFWASAMWGRRRAGLFAFAFLLFDPNILAHGRYSTTDVGGITFLTLAGFLLWRLWQVEQWHWGRWSAAGVVLGLAFGSKLSMLAFAPIFAVAALLPVDGRFWSWRGVWRRWGQLLSAGLLSILVVWALFAFEWGPFQFRTGWLTALNGGAGPMPTFWAGVEKVLLLSGGGRPAFLLGRFSSDGFLAYFPVALAVKTPLVTLALALTAAFWLVRRASSRVRALFLLLPALLYFGLSLQSGLNIGYRHLLPMLPFLYLLISGLAAWRWGRGALVAGILGLLLADVAVHPHYLSYFNLLAGGPENGRNILVDSNIDWGQDLLRLQDWMEENGVEKVKLGWFGTAVPDCYGIQHEPLPGSPLYQFYSLWGDPPFDPAAPAPGVYAISVSSWWELPLPEDQKYVYQWFRAREPDDRVGYSILIYRVP